MPEVKTRQASEDLIVFWDESCGRPAPPDSFGSPGADEGEEERRGEKIVFPKDGYVRVWVEDSEQFPGTGKGPGNFWLRGQCLNLRECICGFKFVARNSVDPFKRPSIVRAHLANCSRRGDNDPLKRLCALYVKGEVGVRKKSKVPRRRSENRYSAYPPGNPNKSNAPPTNPLASISEGSRFTEI
ncbi:hypothetical protein BT69DRAFT_1292775 [Atractiella rhizophila]|nr:hypothetical protein BT69DRAFT_23620 [Atractiella rhizophila]KAH8929115.1 hypothetical protein BT69DRAFT_1292775 [Atractiella rhizophila]